MHPTSSPSDKDRVRDYFNGIGFDRWRRIYGDDQVNKVQRDIRQGHQQTVEFVLDWLRRDRDAAHRTFCDAGCGTGSLSIPLAAMGAQVFASDISEKMVAEAQRRSPNPANPTYSVSDLASLSGSYDTVICLDVLIHYPLEDAKFLLGHLTSLAQARLIFSFAPKNPYYTLLKRIGEFFPGASKATRAYLHNEFALREALDDLGWKVARQEMTSTQFYFSRLLEAVRK
jgi:magnesium-protoporphyrin O-methyltransferase